MVFLKHDDNLKRISYRKIVRLTGYLCLKMLLLMIVSRRVKTS